MVNLQIHLPPASEDVEAKSRDSRDVVEENIARATVLYGLLASIADKKGFKALYYGQEHVGLEIIAKSGEVRFYAAAPENLVPVIRQAISSTYKSAKVEEVPDHNLFDPQIKPESVIGTELALKEDYAYPIATYLDSKQDIMKALLGALSELKGEDGAGIQVLLRPAGKDWTKNAQAVAKKIAGKDDGNFLKELLLGFFKSPESKDGNPAAKKELTNLEKGLIESIEKKIMHPGFEVLIRVVTSTTDIQRSRDIQNNISAAFALTNAPKSNSFKVSAAKKIGKFVDDFNLRIFPANAKRSILNTNEMATIFHLPDETNIPTSQLERQTSKQVDGPRNFSEAGLLLGHNVFRGEKKAVFLSDEDRMRHMYIVGQTGTGKSVLLENLILQDMAAGKGFAFVDPHGETADRILSMIPEDCMDKVVYFNPGSLENPMGFNIFEHDSVDHQDELIQEAIAMLYKLYDPHHQGIMGPRYEHTFRNAAKLIMADPAGGTFIDIPKLFNDRRFVEQKLRHVKDQTVIDFWRKEIVDAARSNEFGDMKSWFVAKFSAFLSNNMMRNIIGQNESSFNLRQIMDEGKMMIINLSFGRTGELNMKLLGMLFVIKFQMAAFSRADVAEEQRPDFTLYIDEFQNFATDSFANILSGARKYRLSLVVANQHMTQLKEEMRDSVLGNVGTAVSFRIGAEDADKLVKQFYHERFEISDLTRLPLGHTITRTLIGGTPTAPFNMETLPPQTAFDNDRKERNEKLLLGKYGRPRAEVEEEINKRLEVREPGFADLPPSPGMSAALPPGNLRPGLPPRPPKLPPGNKFMEDWLKRRRGLLDELAKKEQAPKQPQPVKTGVADKKRKPNPDAPRADASANQPDKE